MPRPLLAALLAALGLAPSLSHGADVPPRLTLEVGQKAVIGGYAGMCDDLKVATITLDANATITAIGPGSTLCSSLATAAGGTRKIVRVVVQKKE
jgi:hypothetical protein